MQPAFFEYFGFHHFEFVWDLVLGTWNLITEWWGGIRTHLLVIINIFLIIDYLKLTKQNSQLAT
jgi:hypothetical protein